MSTFKGDPKGLTDKGMPGRASRLGNFVLFKLVPVLGTGGTIVGFTYPPARVLLQIFYHALTKQ